MEYKGKSAQQITVASRQMECGGCYSQTNNAAHGHTPPQDTQVLSKAFGKLALLDIAYGDAATPPLGSSLLQVRCGLLTLQVHLHTQLPLLLNHYFRSKQLGAALLVAVEACHRRPKQVRVVAACSSSCYCLTRTPATAPCRCSEHRGPCAAAFAGSGRAVRTRSQRRWHL